MRILLFGCDGQLGGELQSSLASLGEVIAVNKEDLDLTKVDIIPTFIDKVHPEFIVNAAAYTNVDQAEIELDVAYTVNAITPGVMAESARRSGSLFIHYSTDYVFDGQKGKPYTEGDSPNPINAYGHSKLAGEQAVQAVGGSFLILRTSCLYGLMGSSFPCKVLAWAREQKVMRIVEDQVGSPTWCRVLAECTAALLSREYRSRSGWPAERSGLYHVAGKGSASRFEWAKRILELDPHPEEQLVEEIQPARTEEFPTPAKRPENSALDCSRFEDTFDLLLPDWDSSLAIAMAEGS
ncbi:MAG: dTDP-4-dehydrorhamnose reductase [Chloroflexi bacterium RBG_16_48_8]|nr:MAG: dTDP-4-dehydrorhamnose reductase [Chloroflexi bacterium RBG_16_48_8]